MLPIIPSARAPGKDYHDFVASKNILYVDGISSVRYFALIEAGNDMDVFY